MKRLLLSFLLVVGTNTTHTMAAETLLDSGKGRCAAASEAPTTPATKTLIPAKVFGVLNCGRGPLLAFILTQAGIEKPLAVTLPTPLMSGELIPIRLINPELADCVVEVTFFFPDYKYSVPEVNFCYRELGIRAN